MISSDYRRRSALKKPGESWQLNGQQQLIVISVKGEWVTLGLPLSAGQRHSAPRMSRTIASDRRTARPRSGYFWFPQGGPCMFVVSVRSSEPVTIEVGHAVVAEEVIGDCVRLSYRAEAPGQLAVN